MKPININGQIVSDRSAPFVIAEMSGNHNQSLDTALKIVDAAAESGASAIKLQTYLADTMTLDLKDDEFKIKSPQSLWNGLYLYDLYKMAHTPWEWHKQIFEYANQLGLVAFSSPFDDSAVKFLEELDVPCYKIASFENIDLPLIEKVAKTNKPMFLSTGLASEDEIKEAVECARDYGCKDLILLKCTSAYPASSKNANLATIEHLKKKFNCWVGISDHTQGVATSVAGVALGAVVVEKHIVLKEDGDGVDAAFSMDEDDFSLLCKNVVEAWEAVGQVSYGPTDSEMDSLNFRRTLYVVEDISKGEILTTKNLKRIRPGNGMHPKYYKSLLGKMVNCEISKGTPMNMSFIDKKL